MTFTYLDWDSNFFNIKIGRIDVCSSDLKDKVIKLTKEKVNEEYGLIYLFCPENYYINYLNFKLVDRKILYFKDKLINTNCTNVDIFKGNEQQSVLLELAYLGGEYSRFKKDKTFSADSFYRLYKEWIIGSISGRLADLVFIYTYIEDIVGFATLKIADNKGIIKLISVSEKIQRKGVGTNLINAVNNYLFNAGIFYVEVATQMQNRKACHFYEANGFTKKSVTNIYHYWAV